MPLPEHVRGYLIRLLERDAAERAQADAELDALARAAEIHQTRPLPEALRGWLNSATGQMRWKRARPVAAKELADHLSDQYEAFLDEGMDESAAAEATAREMGDAVETGTRLDRAWRPRPDWVMLGIVLAVAAVGKVVQYLLGMNPANEVPILATTQVGIYLYGVVFLFVGYYLDYTIFGRHCKLLYTLWCVVGLLMAFGPLQRIQSGANFYLRQWVWFFPVLFAGILYSQRGKGTAGIRNCLLYMLGMWFFAMFAPSTSALCVLTVVSCGMLAAAVWRGAFGKRTGGRLVLALLPVLMIAAYAAYLFCFYDSAREQIAALLHPQAAANGDGYMGSVIQRILFGIPAPEIEPIDTTWLFARIDGISDWILTIMKMRLGGISHSAGAGGAVSPLGLPPGPAADRPARARRVYGRDADLCLAGCAVCAAKLRLYAGRGVRTAAAVLRRQLPVPDHVPARRAAVCAAVGAARKRSCADRKITGQRKTKKQKNVLY